MLPKSLSRLADRAAVGALSMLPLRFARRFLHLLQETHALTDRWGFTVREKHFYDPIPDFSALDSDTIARRRESPAIDWRLGAQRANLQGLIPFAQEIRDLHAAGKFDFENSLFEGMDAAVLYALLRKLKPAKLIEIGCGFSTRIATLALAHNRSDGHSAEHISIEPYPGPEFRGGELPVQLIARKIEEVPLDTFAGLSRGDVLFIDSTHTVKFNSDVCREVLEILPAIASGVWVHFHDIFFPHDYPPHWLLVERRAWNEQYLVEAFLSFNNCFQIELANHWLSIDARLEAARLWEPVGGWKTPSYRCSSLWLKKL